MYHAAATHMLSGYLATELDAKASQIVVGYLYQVGHQLCRVLVAVVQEPLTQAPERRRQQHHDEVTEFAPPLRRAHLELCSGRITSRCLAQ